MNDPALAKYTDVIAVGASGVKSYALKANGELLVADFVNPQNNRCATPVRTIVESGGRT
ncbi:MAG: hypothetical protein JOZ84_07410 [Methylobacteriaceae bacterium]|nr:hypothetical protein [Methylobacteriaceae bacterium]MBV9394222.1 hypothetical protein [Methylobacteriaceae bacterium]